MAQDTIILHLDWQVFLGVLSDEELGQWTRAVLRYMDTGELPAAMSKPVEVAFYAAFERIGRDLRRYKAISEVRREAGKQGGARSAEARKLYSVEANEAKRSKSKQAEAKSTLPYPYPKPIPNTLSSSSDDDSAGPKAGWTMTTTTDLLEFSTAAFEGSRVHISQSLSETVDVLGLDLTRAVLKSCAAAGGHSWAYVEAAVKKCIATGVTTVEEYEAHHQRETGRRVDRAAPSGNDILAAARSRPLRLKREE